ncbi:MAG TPA: pilus assembly protein N-terminal domain-containing protein [Gemmatimonadaceae bacterium]|nr:pilus assembly protein N-terminal domain-containing protein [Gemmatimonadaceae bacterium]
MIRFHDVVLGVVCSLFAAALAAQTPDSAIIHVDMSVGRSYPITTPAPITQVSVADPAVADVAVIGARDLVINAKTSGETDVILWDSVPARNHYRISVHSPSDRKQILLSVKFAEVRRDFLRNFNLAGLYRDAQGHVRVGSGLFNSDNAINQSTGVITIPANTGFGTILTDFGTDRFLAFLDAQTQKGNARLLAEPNLMAANTDSASFLAGGEIPIPVVQNVGAGGAPTVTIQYREFGIRLNFTAEIVSDSLLKLKVEPEVSSLDFGNAITISGFRIPALRTRRIESTVDVKRDESLVISGLFDDERQKVRTGIPLLMDIPILGALFSSSQWQRNQTELLVVVTPVIIDPMHPPARDILHFRPDTTLPARKAIEPRLPDSTSQQTKKPQQ